MSETKSADVFEVKVQTDGKEVTVQLAIQKPSAAERTEADKIYSKVWAEAVEKTGSPVRAQIPSILKYRGLWSDAEDEKFGAIDKELKQIEKKLLEGGNGYPSLEDAKAHALLARERRSEYYRLALTKTALDDNTAEGQAENAKLNYLISVCTVYNIGRKKYYKDINDYYNRVNEPVAASAVRKYMEFINGVDYDFEKNYPENKFLIEYGFMNDKLQLLDENGHAVNEKGERVNEFGQRVNDKGQRINVNGDPIDEKGDLIVESKPFLDKDGKPILPKNKIQTTVTKVAESQDLK